jgi:hypothetical protein
VYADQDTRGAFIGFGRIRNEGNLLVFVRTTTLDSLEGVGELAERSYTDSGLPYQPEGSPQVAEVDGVPALRLRDWTRNSSRNATVVALLDDGRYVQVQYQANERFFNTGVFEDFLGSIRFE